jgi:hypothetical protein
MLRSERRTWNGEEDCEKEKLCWESRGAEKGRGKKGEQAEESRKSEEGCSSQEDGEGEEGSATEGGSQETGQKERPKEYRQAGPRESRAFLQSESGAKGRKACAETYIQTQAQADTTQGQGARGSPCSRS